MKHRTPLSCLCVLLAMVLLLGPVIPAVSAEAGNSFDAAQAIKVNTDYSDAISASGDNDYFSFSLSQAGTVTLQLTHKDLVKDNTYWRVALYNDRQKEICTCNVIGNGTTYKSFLVGLAKGTYYIRVSAGTNRSAETYKLRVNYTATPNCENELNDSFDTATRLTLNTSYAGSTNDANDDDYYAFSLTKTGTVTLTLTHPDLVNNDTFWIIYLYNDRQKEICRCNVSGSGTEYNSYLVGLAKGTYYARIVNGTHTSTGTYGLCVNYTPTEHCETELNDSFDAATPIPTDTPILGSTNDADDDDYYAFSLDQRGTVTLTMEHPDYVNKDTYWIIYLYNDRQKVICRCNVSGDGTRYESYLVGLDRGTYYARITNGTHTSTETYSLRVNYTPTPDCETELNDSFDTATSIPVDTPILGSTNDADDDDYYVFTLEKTSSVRIRLAHPDLVDKSSFWNWYLYDDRHTQISRGTFSGNGSQGDSALTLLDSGTYYVMLSNGTKLSTGTYALTVCTYCGGGDICPGRDFVDMPPVDNWAHAPIDWAVVQRITAGTDKTHFSPNDTCTRAQIVTFLWRAKGSPNPKSANNPFTDVKPQDYYYKAVLWAVENGITAGTSNTTFSPGQGCTRGQVVTFLWRMEGRPKPQGVSGQDGAYNPFRDVKEDTFYFDAVLWAVEKGITMGTSATTFEPERTCTRAQIVSFLYRDLAQ